MGLYLVVGVVLTMRQVALGQVAENGTDKSACQHHSTQNTEHMYTEGGQGWNYKLDVRYEGFRNKTEKRCKH